MDTTNPMPPLDTKACKKESESDMPSLIVHAAQRP